jgi:chemotaxis protein CheX
MRVEYINPFVESTFDVLKEVLDINIKRGDLKLKNTSMQIQGVAAMVGLAGDVQGRVLFDMSQETALFIAGVMNGATFTVLDEMAKDTIQELANMITARAITKLGGLGYRFDLTPPTLFTGEHMAVSTNIKVEALVVPMELDGNGKFEVNVAIRERS